MQQRTRNSCVMPVLELEHHRHRYCWLAEVRASRQRGLSVPLARQRAQGQEVRHCQTDQTPWPELAPEQELMALLRMDPKMARATSYQTDHLTAQVQELALLLLLLELLVAGRRIETGQVPGS